MQGSKLALIRKRETVLPGFLNIFANRLLAAGKPHKVVITGVACKLVTIVNALVKSDLRWPARAS